MKLFDRLIPKLRRVAVQIVGEQTAWADREAYRNGTVRESIDAIARHAGKLKPRHMYEGNPVHDDLERLLQIWPNPAMNSYDMFYKLVTQTMLKNNGFLYINWRNGRLAGLYPVDYTAVTAEEDIKTGAVLMHFQLISGREFWADYQDVIHLRRFFAERPMLGADNLPMNDAVELVNASNAGTVSAIKNGTVLRGILKVTKKALDPKETKKRRDEFLQNYANPEDGSGVAALDADMEYTPLDPSKMYTIKAEERRQIKNEVYSYFGINEKIVHSTYSEDEWNAFYESVLEPIAIQLSLEFTSKLFTRNQQADGHEIVMEANRLQYASAGTKINLVKTLGMLGIILENEGREVFNMYIFTARKGSEVQSLEIPKSAAGGIDEAEVQRIVEEYLAANPPAPGEPGKDGEDGKTPVKGVDYFTDEDIDQIATEAAKQVNPETSWNDLTDKPFYREDATIQIEYNDANEYNVPAEDGTVAYYYVAPITDYTLITEQGSVVAEDGQTYQPNQYSGGDMYYTNSGWDIGAGPNDAPWVFVVSNAPYTFTDYSYGDCTFNENGLYVRAECYTFFMNENTYATTKITQITYQEIKCIDAEFLPDGVLVNTATASASSYGKILKNSRGNPVWSELSVYDMPAGVPVARAASVGQTIRVTAVNQYGEPSAWECADASAIALPAVTADDSGKFLRVSADGAWAAETISNAEEASF